MITDENEEIDEKAGTVCTKYGLVGVVVHSGQASGGHYYSYILHRCERAHALEQDCCVVSLILVPRVTRCV